MADSDAMLLLDECCALDALQAVTDHLKAMSRLMRSAGIGWAHAEAGVVDAQRAASTLS
jgi:hypothetical protein